MKTLNLLSRAEMKKVMGGVAAEGYTVLECKTPNGTESWRRPNCLSSDATTQCQAIYPAYKEGVEGLCVVVVTPGGQEE